MNARGLNDTILCYLTPEAQKAVQLMVDAGLDRDLAVGVLEQLWKDSEIFELPEDEANGDD